MNNDFIMNTDEVRTSGANQKNIAEGFNSAVHNIFSTIGSICASEWKGLSADKYYTLTDSYRDDMNKLGSLIDNHGDKDTESANRMDNLDQDLANMM